MPFYTVISTSAHEFNKARAESGFAGSGGTQTFKIKGNTISCSSAAIDGGSTTLKEETLPVEATYSSCTSSSKAATVSAARFLFNANNTVKLDDESTVTIVTKPTEGTECVFTLPESNSLEKATYTNSLSGVTINAALKGISYELKEVGTTACGTNGEKGSTAEYSGELKTEKYTGMRCVFAGWGKGRYSDAACTKESALFGFYENVATFTAEEWK